MSAKSPKAKPKKPTAIKPEAVLRAKPKTTPPLPKKAVARPKKTHHKKSHLGGTVRRLLKKRIPRRVFLPIVAIVLAGAVVVTGSAVLQSVKTTNTLLDKAAKQANVPFLIAKKEADLIRIIGTSTKRQAEIENYQSAPADLQAFMMKDYRQFKEQCIAAGALPDDVGYKVENVIYDSYAIIKRSCSGTETAIAKKFENGWAIAFSGNVLPPCSLINDYDIPQGASYYCQQNSITYINPNP